MNAVCRKLGVSKATFCRWKKRYGSLGVSELRELAQLWEENRKLKQLAADPSLDEVILQETLPRRMHDLAGARIRPLAENLPLEKVPAPAPSARAPETGATTTGPGEVP